MSPKKDLKSIGEASLNFSSKAVLKSTLNELDLLVSRRTNNWTFNYFLTEQIRLKILVSWSNEPSIKRLNDQIFM